VYILKRAVIEEIRQHADDRNDKGVWHQQTKAGEIVADIFKFAADTDFFLHYRNFHIFSVRHHSSYTMLHFSVADGFQSDL